MGRNVNIFGANMSSSGHVRENKYILILGEGPTQELNTTTLTTKTKYPINFTQPNIRLDKIYRFITIYGEIRHLVLIGYGWYDKVFYSIKGCVATCY